MSSPGLQLQQSNKVQQQHSMAFPVLLLLRYAYGLLQLQLCLGKAFVHVPHRRLFYQLQGLKDSVLCCIWVICITDTDSLLRQYALS